MADPYAGSGWSSGAGSGFNIPVPQYHALQITKPKHHDHSIIHNLLTDVRDATVGLPVGLAHTGKALGQAVTGNLHPLEDIGHAVETYYKETYGNGWKGFAQSFHDHPLQPLLDLASVVSLGGTVAGRGAMLAARGAEMAGAVDKAEAIRTGALGTRPHGRTISVIKGAPDGARYYARNPAIRARQKVLDGMFHAVGEHPVGSKLFGTGGLLRDTTDAGKQARFLHKARGDRAVATYSMFKREGIAAKALFQGKVDPGAAADLLYPHIYDVARSHAFTVSAEKLKENGGKLADGWGYLARKRKASVPLQGFDPHLFDSYSRRVGNSLKADTKKKAATDGRGNYYVIRDRTREDIQREMMGSHKALHALYNKPTQVWKWATLAISPRYFVNNVIGNNIMLAASQNPAATAKSIYNVTQIMHGERKARSVMDHVDRAAEDIRSAHNYFHKWYTGATQGFTHDVTRDQRLAENLANAGRLKNPHLLKAVKFGQQGFYGVTHKVSDTYPRMVVIDSEIRKTALYRKWYRKLRKEGYSRKDAHHRAADQASADPKTRYQVIHNVDNVLGDYHTFTGGENLIKRLVPFYSWDRAIMRHGASLANERPVQAAAMAQISNQGVDETQDYLGKHIPDFLKGVAPLESLGLNHDKLSFLGPLNPIGEKHAGREQVMATQGLNPYSAIPDVTDLLGSLFHQSNGKGGETLSSQLNPVATGVIQHYTGTSLLSGKKLSENGGLFRDVAQQTVESTPWARLIKTVSEGRPHPKVTQTAHGPSVKNPLLYRGDTRQQVDSLIGVPVKEVSTKEAQQLGNQDLGIKTPKLPTPKVPGFSASDFPTHKHSTSTRSRRRSRRRSTTLRARLPRPKKFHVSHKSFLPKPHHF